MFFRLCSARDSHDSGCTCSGAQHYILPRIFSSFHKFLNNFLGKTVHGKREKEEEGGQQLLLPLL